MIKSATINRGTVRHLISNSGRPECGTNLGRGAYLRNIKEATAETVTCDKCRKYI